MTKRNTERYRYQDDHGYWHCETCGAVVAHCRKHDEWHEAVGVFRMSEAS